jgi:PAS domain-containing protein
MSDVLVDEIYEAGLAPERWPALLEKLAALGGGAGASFVAGPQHALRWVATPEIARLIEEFGSAGVNNPRMSARISARHPGFQRDHDFLAPHVVENHPFFTRFMRPRGYGWCLGTVVFAPELDPIIFTVERRHRDGPAGDELVAAFDGLRPHLARALMVSARLGLERARAKAEALAAIDVPAAALGRNGRLIAANPLFAELLPRLAEDRPEGLALRDSRADRSCGTPSPRAAAPPSPSKGRRWRIFCRCGAMRGTRSSPPPPCSSSRRWRRRRCRPRSCWRRSST